MATRPVVMAHKLTISK